MSIRRRPAARSVSAASADPGPAPAPGPRARPRAPRPPPGPAPGSAPGKTRPDPLISLDSGAIRTFGPVSRRGTRGDAG
ncbi:hypothetical protein ADK96_03545 [Streptomyces sp. IGB124]|nr:hypothetical protein ADK96_03545 [Streptomyces sp. IGB124]